MTKEANAEHRPKHTNLFEEFSFYVYDYTSPRNTESNWISDAIEKEIIYNGGTISPLPTNSNVKYILVPTFSQVFTELPDGQNIINIKSPTRNWNVKRHDRLGWDIPRLVEYFGQTIDNYGNIQDNLYCGGRVVLRWEWIKRCLEAGKVLGEEDDWGGMVVRSRLSTSQHSSRPSTYDPSRARVTGSYEPPSRLSTARYDSREKSDDNWEKSYSTKDKKRGSDERLTSFPIKNEVVESQSRPPTPPLQDDLRKLKRKKAEDTF